MATIKRESIEELYELYKTAYNAEKEHLDYAFEDTSRSEAAHDKAAQTFLELRKKEETLAEEMGWDTANLVHGLLHVIFPLSISRYMKCLDVCGVEVE